MASHLRLVAGDFHLLNVQIKVRLTAWRCFFKGVPFSCNMFFWCIYLENIEKYHVLKQLWLVLGVKLMEINSNLFSRYGKKHTWTKSRYDFLGVLIHLPFVLRGQTKRTKRTHKNSPPKKNNENDSDLAKGFWKNDMHMCHWAVLIVMKHSLAV